MALPQFPEHQEFASILFDEAARHLLDARILHINGRYPASITSSMKAVELGLKSLLVLVGGALWMEKLFQTHKVWTEYFAPMGQGSKKYAALKPHRDAILNKDASFDLDIQNIESLIPTKLDASNLTLDHVVNTEYPFLVFDPNAEPPMPPTLFTPSNHFTTRDSLEHFQTARSLLRALDEIYSDIGAWGTVICPNV